MSKDAEKLLSFQGNLYLSELYQLKDCDGYELSHAFYTAMTADWIYWQTLLTLQVGERRVNASLLKQELNRTWFMVQDKPAGFVQIKAKNDAQTDFWQRLRYYQGPAPCFHAKMAFLKYTKADSADYYRIGVLSKNLESGDAYQNICILDGFADGAGCTDNGERLWQYLQYCRKWGGKTPRKETDTPNADPMLQAHLDNFASIQRIRLPENCRIYFNGLGSGETKAAASCLWDVLVGEPLERGKGVQLSAVCRNSYVGSTYWDVAKPENRENSNGAPALAIWNCCDESRRKDADKTHMKVYWKKMRDQNDLWEVWSGSANCSAPALGKEADGSAHAGQNVECLVQITEVSEAYIKAMEQSLQALGHRLMENAPIPEGEFQTADRILHEIIKEHSFRYEYSSRAGKYVLEAYERESNRRLPRNKEWTYQEPKRCTVWKWTITSLTELGNDLKKSLEGQVYKTLHGKNAGSPDKLAILSLWRDDGGQDRVQDCKCVEPEYMKLRTPEDSCREAVLAECYKYQTTNWISRLIADPDPESRKKWLEKLNDGIRVYKKLQVPDETLKENCDRYTKQLEEFRGLWVKTILSVAEDAPLAEKEQLEKSEAAEEGDGVDAENVREAEEGGAT